VRFLRFGPSIVFLRSADPMTTEGEIARLFGVEPLDTDEAIRKSREFETLLFVTDDESRDTVPPERAFLLREVATAVLGKIVNEGLAIRVDVESTLIILRFPDRVEDALKELARKYGGEVMTLREALDRGEATDTIIAITRKKLRSPIGPEDIEGALLVGRDFLELYRELLFDVPLLVFKLLPEWNELTIKLYDTDKRYEENIERLILMIEDLDLGFIVGEGWDWDYPRPFMRVPVYKLKLLTWEKPERVKFLLKGLEYKGYKRLCDIDVFVGKKKIDWVELGDFKSKFELAQKAREELEKMLSERCRKRLKAIEDELLKAS